MAGPEPTSFRRLVSPDPRIAVRLQFERDRCAVRARAPSAYAVTRAEEVLHVMAELVSDHVRLGEVARRAEAPRQLVEEAQIEVDLVIGRAVERAGRALGAAAA